MLRHWRYSEVGSPSITFSECTVAAYNTMVNVFLAKSDVTFKYKDDIGTEHTVQGRGCSQPTAIKLKQSCIFLHQYANAYYVCPTLDSSMKVRFKVDDRNYRPQGAPSVDPVEFLPAIYNAIFNKFSSWTLLTKVCYWFMILLAINHFYRPSEMCQYCPLATNIKLPPYDSDIDKDGIPKYLIISLTGWKGRLETGAYEMVLHRNYVTPRYCPVIWGLTWLKMSGIKAGPVVCGFNNEGNIMQTSHCAKMSNRKGTNYTVYLDSSGEIVNLSYKKYSRILKRIFEKAGYSNLTPYTIRKFSVKWGARCGAKDWQLKNTGRWYVVSRHFHIYVQQGHIEEETATTHGKVDEIRKLWVYRPTSFHKVMHPELNK